MNEATREAMAHIKGIYPPIDDPVEAALNASADAAYAQYSRALWALRRHQAAKGDPGAIADCASMDAMLALTHAPRYSHSDGKADPELKARFDAVCRSAAADQMKDWMSPQDYVGGPLIMAPHPTPACGTSGSAKPAAPVDPKAPKPPSEALMRAIGAKKP